MSKHYNESFYGYIYESKTAKYTYWIIGKLCGLLLMSFFVSQLALAFQSIYTDDA